MLMALFATTLGIVGITTFAHVAYVRQENGNWVYGLGSLAGFLAGLCASLSALAAIVFRTGIRWRGSSYR
jgi:hypothetical protein